MSKEEVLQSIENLRAQMVELGLASSFVDVRVVKLSDQLDQLLNKYQNMITKSNSA